MTETLNFINVCRGQISIFRKSFNALFGRNARGTTLTISVIAISLLIPIVFYLLINNVLVLTENMKTGRELTVYFKDNVSAENASEIRDAFSKDYRIQEATLITAEDAMESFSQSLGITDADKWLLNDNPLPNAIMLTPKSEYLTESELNKMIAEIEKSKEVLLVQLDKQWVNRLNSIIKFLNATTIGIGCILLLSVILSITNCISSIIVKHKEEIEVMKLVGATNSYIITPYVYLGMWFGFIGGAIAIWISAIIVYVAGTLIYNIAESYGSHIEIFGINIVEIFVVTGSSALIAAIVAFVSARVNIARIEPNI